jgi:Putative peptidoglycan binding domain/CHAP domain
MTAPADTLLTGFQVAPRVTRGAGHNAYEPKAADPRSRPIRIYALDPTRFRDDGAIAVVDVPYEPVAPGPVGSLLAVLNDERAGDESIAPLQLDDPRIMLDQGRDPSATDPAFRAQMAYAVCAITYGAFKRALGRDVMWGFDRAEADGAPARLVIRPSLDGMRNAYYDPARGELRFGIFRADDTVEGLNVPGGLVCTALSHDVVVHEMSHALLDGLRAKFMIPTAPDVAAFHEAFADIIAVFQRFTYRDVVRKAIVDTRGDLGRPSILSKIGGQFAETTSMGSALRNALAEPDVAKRDSPDPHERGEQLLAAVFRAFVSVYRRKALPQLRLASNGTGEFPPGRLPDGVVEALTDVACKLAAHFLNICIRAIDYCPPLDIEFGEYLRAVITADADLVPDDPWDYREAWVDAFRAYKIIPDGVPSLTEDSLLWRPPEDAVPTIQALSFEELRFRGDPGHPANADALNEQAKAFGRIAANPAYAHSFGLAFAGDPALEGDAVDLPTVQSVRTSRRVGPDGQVVFDLVAEITQRRTVEPRPGIPRFQFYGGATAIFDPFGNVRYVIRKSIVQAERLARQAAFIGASRGENAFWLTTSDGERLERPQRFRLLHERLWAATPNTLLSRDMAMSSNETVFKGPISPGMSGPLVRTIQEWLTLHKFGLAIDGVFGPATGAAVTAYQQSVGLPTTGFVDAPTFSSLVAPLTNALQALSVASTLSVDVPKYAQQHLDQHPREVGGQNAGPWVRTYMNGNEGPQWPWCAGFACFVLKQASAGKPLPLTPSFSCDELAKDAMARGTFRTGGAGFETSQIAPGSLFLVRRPAPQRGWHHTGIVVGVAAGSVMTIEGNTNEAGSREGFEVSRRVRDTTSLDFIATTTA